ncbi:hypothetical protein C0995_015649 [Termitomyces sp. Mi166|nr:hypothetical protein C0995_015649 [Termitomyces sp. Mi166\
MANDAEKRPQRTNRIWLILLFFLAIITFTHYAAPTPAPAPLLPPQLTPKNYLNATDPFDFCPVYGPADTLSANYGAHVLSKIVMHAGSGERIHRLINRALAGQPVTISIIGGSVSACHGAGDDPVAPSCYPARFFQWWNSIFPHPATELTNGAMRRTNSGYFGYCSTHHIPDATDLVIIELDSDDTTDPDMLENFETLIRSLLLLPSTPAVLLLGHFNPQTHTIYGFAGPDHTHDIVAQFYDVPHISTKPILYPLYIRDPHAIDKYFVDPVLASENGHKVLADVLQAYIQREVCRAWGVLRGSTYPSTSTFSSYSPGAAGLFGGVGQRKGVPEPDADADAEPKPPQQQRDVPPQQQQQQQQLSVTPIPPGRINTRPGGRPFEEIAPYCVSANDLINPLPPSMFYGTGWGVFHASSSSEDSGQQGRMSTTSHYWHSVLPGSKLRVPIQVGAGDVGVYYLREPRARVGKGSSVDCWVDDNVAGARRIVNVGAVAGAGEGAGDGDGEDVQEETPSLVLIDHFVTRGSHFVECVLGGDKESAGGVPMFRIVGIFAT